jgi:hypothetical protein
MFERPPLSIHLSISVYDCRRSAFFHFSHASHLFACSCLAVDSKLMRLRPRPRPPPPLLPPPPPLLRLRRPSLTPRLSSKSGRRTTTICCVSNCCVAIACSIWSGSKAKSALQTKCRPLTSPPPTTLSKLRHSHRCRDLSVAQTCANRRPPPLPHPQTLALASPQTALLLEVAVAVVAQATPSARRGAKRDVRSGCGVSRKNSCLSRKERPAPNHATCIAAKPSTDLARLDSASALLPSFFFHPSTASFLLSFPLCRAAGHRIGELTIYTETEEKKIANRKGIKKDWPTGSRRRGGRH